VFRTSKEEKERMLEENKVVFDADHPVWGVKNIPDPDWSDLKWWKSASDPNNNQSVRLKKFHLACNEVKIWRIAKFLEQQNDLEQKHQLDFMAPQSFTGYSYRAPSERLFVQAVECGKIDALKGLEMFFAVRPHKIRNLYECDAWLVRACLEKGQLDVLVFLAENNQLKEHHLTEARNLARDMARPDVIDVLDESLKRNYGAPAILSESSENKEWFKISDTMIEQNLKTSEGGSLKRIFDFAAKTVKTIERIPGEQPATFENSFVQVGSEDVEQASVALKSRGGRADYHVKGRSVSPLS